MQLDPLHPSTQVQVPGVEHSLLVPQAGLQFALLHKTCNDFPQ